MNIEFYDIIFQKLVEYNNGLSDINYGNVVVPYGTQSPSYPYTVVDEVRNVPFSRGYARGIDRITFATYKVNIYAMQLKDVSKQYIARIIADQIDNFFVNILGMQRLSYFPVPLENGSSLYAIELTYTCNIQDFRQKIL